MRISDWSSDVCSSDLSEGADAGGTGSGQEPSQPKRVLVHSSGFRMSPYADIRPAGGPTDNGKEIEVPRRPWHRSPRSEERRVGKEWVRTWRFGWWPAH